MWIDYRKYQYWPQIDQLLPIAQRELKIFLETKTHHDMANYIWFEKKYGMKVCRRAWDWYVIPNLRGSEETELSYLLPELTKAAKSLPGIINFSLNAFAPGGEAPAHLDYDFDMKEHISKADNAYAILIGVDVADAPLEKCGFQLLDEKIKFNTNDIIAFDGGLMHGSWNFTDQWRYTINMDIKQKYWNI